MAVDAWVPAAIAFMTAGGGISAAIVSLRKSGPEAGQIIVATAQDAVILSKDMMADMREAMEQQAQKMERLEKKVDVLQAELEERDAALVEAKLENARLTGRVAQLEDHVNYLQRADPPPPD